MGKKCHNFPTIPHRVYFRKGPAAPAPARVGAGEEEESCLGTVPHTLRGSLHAFTQVRTGVTSLIEDTTFQNAFPGRTNGSRVLAVHSVQPASVGGA